MMPEILFAYRMEERDQPAASIESLLGLPRYDHICRLTLRNVKDLYELPLLPSSLTTLIIVSTHLRTIADIPAGVRHLCLRDNRLREFPVVSACSHLEEIDLSHNDIETLDTVFPNSVTIMDVSYNRLRSVNYACLPQRLARLDLSFNYLKVHPALPPHVFVVCHHNEFDALRPMGQYQYSAPTRPSATSTPAASKPRVRAIYDDGQNVHNHDIQTSALHSVRRLLKLRPQRVRKDYVTEIEQMYTRMKRPTVAVPTPTPDPPPQKKKGYLDFLWLLFPSLRPKMIVAPPPPPPAPPVALPPLRTWCQNQTTHSQFHITYGDLLQHVWSIICEHTAREELEKVLVQELDDSKDMCFTGRITRLVNALNGFVAGIEINLMSPAEQIQHEMSALLKRIERQKMDLPAALAEAEHILTSFDVPSNGRLGWIQAVKDLFDTDEDVSLEPEGSRPTTVGPIDVAVL